MTRPRRGGWRWWGKWAASLTCAGLLAAWVLSRWWGVYLRCSWPHGGALFGLSYSNLSLMVGHGAPRNAPKPWSLRIKPLPSTDEAWGRATWDFDQSWVGPAQYLFLEAPVYAPALLALAGAATLFRLDRPRPGLCSHCRYDLSATPPSAPCPECGRTPAPHAEADSISP
jgi:hypothetical protein